MHGALQDAVLVASCRSALLPISRARQSLWEKRSDDGAGVGFAWLIGAFMCALFLVLWDATGVVVVMWTRALGLEVSGLLSLWIVSGAVSAVGALQGTLHGV
ncbi:MAG: hypothetical protein EOO38_28380 [Cytophagaceae bacterium]|nr:MAG: hypothetical protein EOO38_28380 [Cytophagaceae bacterium]